MGTSPAGLNTLPSFFRHDVIIIIHKEFHSSLPLSLLGAETGDLKGIRVREAQRERKPDLAQELPGLRAARDADPTDHKDPSRPPQHHGLDLQTAP